MYGEEVNEVKMAILMTFIFLILLLLSLLVYSLLTVIRKAEFEEALATPARDKTKQEE
jgi:Na+-transporting methylmalonyl-CoA/oxaloacetate decarboxylase gamma subunit